MKRPFGLLLVLFLLTLLGFLVLSWALAPTFQVVHAQGPDGNSVYYVAPDCSSIPSPCYTAVQDAVDAVDDPGDVVQVAQGTYTDVHATVPYTQMVHLTKTLTIRGGYSPDFGSWDPESYPTVLDARRQGRVFYIQGAASPVIEGLRITGGDGETGGGDWGGGILAVGNSGPALTVTLSHNQIISNYATAGLGTGGGMAAFFCSVVLRDNLVERNEAIGVGGGARFEQSNIDLTNNIFQDNQSQASGGGIYLAYLTNVEMTNTVLIDNQAAFAGGGMVVAGAWLRMKHSTVARNNSGDGTGIYVTGGGIQGKIVSSVWLTNSILVSHTVGLTVTPAPPFFTNTAVLDHTLWDEFGLLAGGGGNLLVTNTYTGSPAFAADGYHLLPTSDAIDRGLDAHVDFDIDNGHRPSLAGYDLGADELSFYVYLPAILKELGP